MKVDLLELLPELFELTFLGASTVVLTIFGTYVERFALATAQGGDLQIGAWAAVIGTVSLYLAFLIATDGLPAKLTAIRNEFADRT